MARFFPRQGQWTKDEYLVLNTNHLVELSNGRLEFLPMPTDFHQAIVAFLYELLKAFAAVHAPGVVRFASLPVELWPGKFREPDILYLKAENAHRIGTYWRGADLVMEVVSPPNAEHDRVTKRQEVRPGRHPRVLDHRPGAPPGRGPHPGRHGVPGPRGIRCRHDGHVGAPTRLRRGCG